MTNDQNVPLEKSPTWGSVFVAIIFTFIGGYFLGVFTTANKSTGALTRDLASVKRAPLPIGISPTQGAREALVTIVEFSDFECPYCNRSVALQKRILEAFPGQ